MYMYMYMFMYILVYVHIYVYIYLLVYVYVYIGIYIGVFPGAMRSPNPLSSVSKSNQYLLHKSFDKSIELHRQGTWGAKDEPVLYIFHPRDLGSQGLRSGELKA